MGDSNGFVIAFKIVNEATVDITSDCLFDGNGPQLAQNIRNYAFPGFLAALEVMDEGTFASRPIPTVSYTSEDEHRRWIRFSGERAADSEYIAAAVCATLLTFQVTVTWPGVDFEKPTFRYPRSDEAFLARTKDLIARLQTSPAVATIRSEMEANRPREV